MIDQTGNLGKALIRKDAWDKVTGKAKYVADIPQEAMHYGYIIRSVHHFAKIISINIKKAENVPGVSAVVTAKDIPGKRVFGPLIQDQPVLALDLVRHIGEPIAIVIASSKAAAQRAAESVKINYEPYQAIFDPITALQPGTAKIHPDGNLAAEYQITEGNVERAFSEADVILDETFKLPRISPAYLEPENSLARWNKDGTITVWVSSQHPFTDQEVIADTLGLPVELVQVKSAVIGGAFGGKEDSSVAVLAALGAWMNKGVVQIVNTRRDSFLAHPKRHPAQIHLSIAANLAGEIRGVKAQVNMDTGAYASYGPAVGIILTETLTGAYRVPSVEISTQVAYTNSPLSGAMRGFGSPQSHFAIESMMDMLADELGMEPVQVRWRNILKPGDQMFTRVVMNISALSLPQCLDKAEEMIENYRKISPTPGRKPGIGLALAAQSMGLGAKVPDDSTHRLKWHPDGSVSIFIGSPDLGQGLAMAAEQITAEALEIPFEKVKSIQLDTLRSPNGNVSCASRMTYMVGNALIDASQSLIDQLLKEASRMLQMPLEQLSYNKGLVTLESGETFQVAEFISRLEDDGRELQSEATFSFPYPKETTPQHLPIGMPHTMFCFGAQIVRVEVDPELGAVDVTHLVAIHDVGRIINKQGVEGQIEGGVAMGLGYALFEHMGQDQGNHWMDGFSTYLIPTVNDIPVNYENIILEIPEASGPYGAKGIGEIPLVPTAPAVANAVYDAVGVRVQELPILPEKLLERIS